MKHELRKPHNIASSWTSMLLWWKISFDISWCIGSHLSNIFDNIAWDMAMVQQPWQIIILISILGTTGVSVIYQHWKHKFVYTNWRYRYWMAVIQYYWYDIFDTRDVLKASQYTLNTLPLNVHKAQSSFLKRLTEDCFLSHMPWALVHILWCC